jgi:formate hydrogenlyase transcriptional activator
MNHSTNKKKKTAHHAGTSQIIPKKSLPNDLILDFIKQIAQVRAKDDLMKIIREHFQSIFYFTHCTVTNISEDKKTFRVYIIDPDSKLKDHKDYKKLITHPHPVNDGIYNTILHSDDPVIIDVDEMIGLGKIPFYLNVLQQSGIRELIGISLQFENKQLGILSFFSDKKKSFVQETFPLIKSIVNHISLAVSNAIAIEAIEKRIRERDLMLSLSDALSRAKSRIELEGVLDRNLKNLINFSHSLVLKWDNEQHLLVGFMEDVASGSWLQSDYNKAASNELGKDAVFFDTVMKSNEPLVFNIEEMLLHKTAPLYFEKNYKSGAREFAITALRSGEVVLGLLGFYAQEIYFFDKEILRLIQATAYHFATAMANVLAHEDIQNREYQKSVLLSLSKEIAAVRNKTDLFRVVNMKLKELFLAKGFAIALIDNEKQTHNAFIIDLDENIKNHDDFDHVLSQNYGIADGVVNRIILSDEPVQFLVSEFSDNADTPEYVKFWKKLDIHTVIGTALKVGENNLGCLLFHVEENEIHILNFSLLKSVCSQISIAISNILANDSLHKRELEKSLLLTFSSQLATARTKKALAVVIKQYLKDIFMISEYIITVRNEDNASFSYFLHDLSAEEPADEGFKIITSPSMPIKGAMTGAVLEANEPIIFSIAGNIKTGQYSFPSESFWKAAGAEHIQGMKLIVANETVGIIWTQPGKINDGLLKGISAQVAVSIANILAMEKIEKQFEEINSYKQQLEEEKSYLQEQVGGSYTYNDVIGSSPEMKNVFQSLSQVSFATSTVLLLGETGTGKELIAKAIHNSSPRKDRLMVKVNCAALPVNLIESELFGHEKGSFTGATERRIGKFELANHGTLFLDEIGEMPLDLQVKLLRAIQEKEIERIGGKQTIKTDVRLIAATNRNLKKEVDEGRFRRDLYYRLNVFPITLPPLRERIADIPLLVTYFTEKYAKNNGKAVKKISEKAMKELMAYHWPGNIRELEHLIERSILITPGNIIKQVHLPSDNRNEQKNTPEDDFLKSHEENEREHILKVLNKCKGKIFGPGGAADILKLHVSTLNSKISKLGIKKNKTYT